MGQGGKEGEKGGSAFGYETFDKTFLRLSSSNTLKGMDREGWECKTWTNSGLEAEL